MAKNVSPLCPPSNDKQRNDGDKEAIRLENLQRKLEGPTIDTERELLTSRRDCITQHVTTNEGTISVVSHLVPDD